MVTKIRSFFVFESFKIESLVMAMTSDSILKLSNTKKLLILVTILCVLGGLYLKTFILPEREDLSDLQRQMDKLMKELYDSKAITRDLQTYRSEEHTSELQSHLNIVCRLLLEKRQSLKGMGKNDKKFDATDRNHGHTRFT